MKYLFIRFRDNRVITFSGRCRGVENYTRGDLNNVDVSGGGTTGLQADLHHPALLYLFVLLSSKWAKTDIDI